MADYRLSANVISRSAGRSSVACAAYRAAERLIDIRTGETHDYTRKRGVVDCTIIAPDNAPTWSHNRAQLWQAVEAVERRKDAQLARELQLSLPHELTHEQRRHLVHAFVREQCVAHGMVADIAIHAPGKEGDHRNHHAHIMLTMRELKGDGFGNKARDWNAPELLATWREQWAHHQNRELERHGHAARVDHRSLADQGIDREPAQHMGPVATDMERGGQASRIGEENREREERNSDRAQNHAAAAVVDLALERERRALNARHALEKAALSIDLEQLGHERKQTILRELVATQERLQATGWRRFMRDLTGRTRNDNHRAENLRSAIDKIQEQERRRFKELERRHRIEQEALDRRVDDPALSPSQRLRARFQQVAPGAAPQLPERAQALPQAQESRSAPWAAKRAAPSRKP